MEIMFEIQNFDIVPMKQWFKFLMCSETTECRQIQFDIINVFF